MTEDGKDPAGMGNGAETTRISEEKKRKILWVFVSSQLASFAPTPSNFTNLVE